MKRNIVDIEAPSLLNGGAYAELSATLDGAIAANLPYEKSSATSLSSTVRIPGGSFATRTCACADCDGSGDRRPRAIR
jgi:hypothetical protein